MPKNYVLTRISYLYILTDIYNMKDSVYTQEKEKDFRATETAKKPLVVVLSVSVILIIILNLINTIFFYQ
jgi:hypothetical protein